MANTGNNPSFVQMTRKNAPVGPDSPPQEEKGTYGAQGLQELGERANQADDRGGLPKGGGSEESITDGAAQAQQNQNR